MCKFACRFENKVGLERRPRLFATRSNPRAGDFATQKSDGNAIEAGHSGEEGPPFLTILAGFIVFLLVCWILASVVMWVIGLIIRLLPSK
ncbi:hypothetical protein SLEP1_g2927 [Rubroshorea leprosula]|uniref:Uncharacterized protein n=1 Tax=Rubroshorea leprosula TaxID=152421 RepID=A0AAV5HSG6_9ROSI|nr:hypothetical protein SLEP1_g2927 [Rubroshorea leprosula]